MTTENTTLHFEWAAPMATDIDRAMTSICISSLSLHPPRASRASNIGRLWDSLEAATGRGLSLAFFMPQSSKAHPATAFNESAAARLHAIGATVHTLPSAYLLHAKTVSIDDAIAWVGSGNWTAAGSTHNREAYLRAESSRIAARLRNHWYEELKKG